ncbi:MAG: phage tail protein [Oscillospiraceae bacterium]|nr:phage tail protein [Oscillospiraceae bacterium]
MWTIYSDDNLIYDARLEDYRITDFSLDLELNKSGALKFTIYPDHPNFDQINKLKSIITVYQDAELYFRGRVLNDTLGFYNQRAITCEGDLSFLLDTVQRPFSFPATETDPATPAAYFAFLLARHNAQAPAEHQFKLGTVTVTDPNDYISRSDTEYSSTWKLLKEGLLDTLGGYLWPRHETDGVYLDYLADFTTLSNQPISFGVNLLSLSTERRGEDIATAVLPLGAKPDDSDIRITISDLANESSDDVCKSGDIVYSKAAEALYGGRIISVVTWDDVTQASNLLTKAKAQLSGSIAQTNSLTITAADLSAAGQDCNSWRLGTYVQATSVPHQSAHGLQNLYLIQKLSLKPLQPAQNKLTVGAVTYGFTELNKKQQQDGLKQVKADTEASQSEAIRELEQRTSSAILQSSESILSKVSDEYYLKSDTDALVSSVSSQITQNADAVEIKFTKIQKDVDDVASGADAKFDEIGSYIRGENGSVTIGYADNSFKQLLSPTKNSFFDGAVEVAYISNKKMFITDGEFTNSLRIGKFAFIPRANGSLAFKKVVD